MQGFDVWQEDLEEVTPWSRGNLHGESGKCDALSLALPANQHHWFTCAQILWPGQVVCLPCKHLALCSFCSKLLGRKLKLAQDL